MLGPEDRLPGEMPFLISSAHLATASAAPPPGVSVLVDPAAVAPVFLGVDRPAVVEAIRCMAGKSSRSECVNCFGDSPEAC